MKTWTIADINDLLRPYLKTTNILHSDSYDLARIQQFMEFLGNPQDSLNVVHIAGTSGKTSTSYYIAAMLQAAGKRTGLTVSPHVVDVTERIQLDLQPMAPPRFGPQLEKFTKRVEESGIPLTYFEILIAFVYQVFADEKVDFAVVETGLGGTLDATNIVHSPEKLCVITDIGLDHMDILGSTVQEIAEQKAGIIQSGNRVIMLEQASEIQDIFRLRCETVGASLTVLGQDEQAAIHSRLGTVFAGLPAYQQRNAGLAFAACRLLGVEENLDSDQIAKALAVTVPGRMETHMLPDGREIILDGAHNPQKMAALTGSLKQRYPGQKFAALIGIKDSKDYISTLQELLPLVSQAIITEFAVQQDSLVKAVEPDALERFFTEHRITVKVVSDNSRALAQLLACPERRLLVTGSIYLIGEIKRSLEQSLHEQH